MMGRRARVGVKPFVQLRRGAEQQCHEQRDESESGSNLP